MEYSGEIGAVGVTFPFTNPSRSNAARRYRSDGGPARNDNYAGLEPYLFWL